MKRILLTLIAALTITAQPYGYGRPGYYDASPSARIERGVRSGLLTHREADRLWKMERSLRYETERAYRSGWGLSHGERRRLEEMRYKLDREISRQIADGERAYRGGWRR